MSPREKGDHPRAGGGTAYVRAFITAPSGPSPRGRGNPKRICSYQCPNGTIPARAGEPQTGRRFRRRPWDHPRAGGGTLVNVAHDNASGGPSPRGRGNLKICEYWPVTPGTIPARAGEPGSGQGDPLFGGDHPRAGGGTGGVSRFVWLRRGPSPRGRGNLVYLCLMVAGLGTIPARAGEPKTAGDGLYTNRDHPRAGGGTVPVGCLAPFPLGPSPRGRGNHVLIVVVQVLARTIPARAGEPILIAGTLRIIWDHPRAGGGTAPSATRLDIMAGPSPRGRGNHRLTINWRIFRGTIPARAGEPGSLSGMSSLLGDHPRAGGGTVGAQQHLRFQGGPSPRGRGNRPRGSRCRRPPGTIPARAGEPQYCRAFHQFAGDHPRAGGGTPRKVGQVFPAMGPSPRGRGNRDKL